MGRLKHALNASSTAAEVGIVAGGGVAYMRSLKVLEKAQFSGEEQLRADLIKRALEDPVTQIASNAGFEGFVVVQHVMEREGVELQMNSPVRGECWILESERPR
jgi:chaperonin GroEL